MLEKHAFSNHNYIFFLRVGNLKCLEMDIEMFQSRITTIGLENYAFLYSVIHNFKHTYKPSASDTLKHSLKIHGIIKGTVGWCDDAGLTSSIGAVYLFR